MSFASKLQKIKDDHPDLDTEYVERSEVAVLVKEALKDEIRAWMEEVGIDGNLQVNLNVRYRKYKVPNVHLAVDYIAIWNNNYASGKWKGWLNLLSIGMRSRKYRHDDKFSWQEWAARVKHNARTDPAYQGIWLTEAFEGRMLNLIQEMFYVIGPQNWEDKVH